MDTPDRNQIGTPLSKFEDSPVFSYISSLSPIKPVKSLHVTQTFNSLSFSSPPSVFTSPHVTCHRESRFLKSHNIADLSNAKENKVPTKDAVTEATNVCNSGNEEQKNIDQGVLIGDGSSEQSKEDTNFPIELPNKLKYNCCSPDYEPTACSGNQTSSVLELPNNSESLSVSAQQAERDLSEDELQVVEISEFFCVEPKPEGSESDLDSLIADASELLIFNSPNDTEAFKGLINRPLDAAAKSCNVVSQSEQDNIDNVENLHVTDQITSEQRETDYHSSNSVAAFKQVERHHWHQKKDYANVATMDSNPSGKMNNESGFINLRGLRRRCLDFEITCRRKMSANGSSSSSCICPSDEKITITDKQIVPLKLTVDSQRCIVPGIGLHLNALAKTLKDCGGSKHENLQEPSSSIQPSASQEHSLSVLASSGRHIDPYDDETRLAEDVSQPHEYLVTEDSNQGSPKKKRRKLETGAENEGCKRCNCKKSKCLKLYCECFAAGVYCIDSCTCQECFNKPSHVDTVLETRKQIESRNPLAFAPKVIRSSDTIPEIGDESNSTPASARHKRGCNCKKSNCLKKYCECYQGGVGCSINCRCEGCKNKFGRKDGYVSLAIEAEAEETETCEKSTAENGLKVKTDLQNNEHMDSTLTTTPSHLCRSLVPMSFSSRGNGKPPRSCFVTGGLHGSHKLEKPNVKFEKQTQAVSDDEMPEILRGDDGSSVNCMKTSPNSKRVSSPHCNNVASPTRRSGRKLILQSIPSFPSLTPHH